MGNDRVATGKTGGSEVGVERARPGRIYLDRLVRSQILMRL
jgi:hypothetical protein